MTHNEVKRIIECGDNNADGEVPFTLQAGNLAIRMDIYSEDDKDVWPIYYYRKEFDDESCWIFINGDVNLYVTDIEVEMFRVLDKLAEEKGLSFFIQNNEYGNSPENSSELER